MRTGEPVLGAILARLPVSLELMLLAEIAALLIGIPLAILCAARSGGRFDRIVTGIAFAKLSIPNFMAAILLIYVFAVELRLLPATGYLPFGEDALGNLRCMVLPALTLALAEWPVLMRVLRSDMIATLQEDYIAMAKAKGLKQRRILFVHALKPSSLTLITVAGINIGRLIGGAVIVETVFALPGIGRLLLGAIYTRDFMILQGVVLFVAAGFVIVNFLVDMLYAVLDPRVRHARSMPTLPTQPPPMWPPPTPWRGSPASAWCSGWRRPGSCAIVLAAALANLLPLPSPTDMDMLERRPTEPPRIGWEPIGSAATCSRA